MIERNESRNHEHRMQHGMTAIELLIGLAVLAIVVLLAVPGSSMLIENYRLKSAMTELIDDIYLARSEALRRASTVRMCPSDDASSCRTDGDWSHGWLVYSDGNGDGIAQGIELIEAFEAPGDQLRIVASGAAQNTAAFTATGLVRDNGSASGEFILCPENPGATPRVVVIDPEGWVSLELNDHPLCEAG